ncbi:MAG: glycosyltransferase family 39 protein [Candidatus Brocadiales bacterium]
MKYLQGSSSHIILIIGFSLLLYIPGLNVPGLGGSSELRYAAVTREMLEDGHWIVPYFHGEIYVHKPPLYFWTAALLSEAGGTVTETTARLPSVLSAVGTVLVTYFLGRSLFGPRAGLLAALMLACSPKFHSYAHAVRLDVMHTFFFTLSLALFYYGYTNKQRLHLVLAGLALGLMALNKGPLTLYFPMAVIFFYLVYCRDLRFLVSKDCLLGVVALLATVLAWAVPAYMEGGSNYINLFYENNCALYAEKDREWDVPLEYLGDVFVGGAPWSLLLPLVLYSYFWKERRSREMTFLLIWVLVIFVSFSLTFQRRSPYILPLFPALIIVVASYIDRRLGENPLKWTYSVLLYVLAVGVGLLAGMIANNPDVDRQVLMITVGFLVLLSIVVIVASIRHKTLYVLLVASLVTLGVCAISQDVYIKPKVRQGVYDKVFCKEVSGMLKPGVPLGVYQHLSVRFAFYFYTDTQIIFIHDEKEFAEFFNSSEDAYCLVSPDVYPALSGLISSLPAKELVSGKKKYMLVSKTKRRVQ